MEDIYGSAELIEWFTDTNSFNNGEFEIKIENQQVFSQENKNRFLNILNIIKRKSQKLLMLYMESSVDINVYCGLEAVHSMDSVSKVIADF